MTLSDSWAIFAVGLIVMLLQYVFTQMVIRRIDRLETNSKESNDKNECAHKEIWIELHRIDKETASKISSIETRCDIEGNIKKLLSTT